MRVSVTEAKGQLTELVRRVEAGEGEAAVALLRGALAAGLPREAIVARRLAYGLHRDAGDHARAARSCWQLFHQHFELDETAAASGWLSRAHRHIREAPGSIG